MDKDFSISNPSYPEHQNKSETFYKMVGKKLCPQLREGDHGRGKINIMLISSGNEP